MCIFVGLGIYAQYTPKNYTVTLDLDEAHKGGGQCAAYGSAHAADARHGPHHLLGIDIGDNGKDV